MHDTEHVLELLTKHTNGQPLNDTCLLCIAIEHICLLHLSNQHLTAQLRWHEQQGHQ